MPSSFPIHQGILEKQIRILFPSVDVIPNARKHAEVKNPSTGSFFEVDVWIPSLALGFEFQDPYHYATVWYSHKPVHTIQYKDNSKYEAMRKGGANLINIPYWWDSKIESLHSFVHFERPDIISKTAVPPVPLNPHKEYYEEIRESSDLMHPSLLGPSEFYESFHLSQNWWLGEKYDGIRCYWNSSNQTLNTRRGAQVQLPFSQQISDDEAVLDGELWGGRNMHAESFKVLDSPNDKAWCFLRVVVFDSIDNQTEMSYEKRFNTILSAVPATSQFLTPAVRLHLCDKQQLEESLQTVITDGGEGLILQLAEATYERGRSRSLIKIKATRADAEGIVQSYNGHILVLHLPTGVNVELVGSDTIAEGLKIENGNIVTYEYDHFTNAGVPVNPRVTRIRTDLIWEDVLRDNQVHNSRLYDLHHTRNTSMKELERETKWRLIFEKIAADRQLDPLLASTWYSIPRRDIQNIKGVKSALGHYQRYSKCLKALFPELPPLDEQKFIFLSKGYWGDVNNRKKFFNKFASDHKFDPLIAVNWYSHIQELTKATSQHKILSYYEGSVANALIHLYPQIGLVKASFSRTKSVRQFFDEFAREKGFEPLVAANWYNITATDIQKKETWSAAMRAYSSNLSKTLMQVYPDIGLDQTQFCKLPQNYWQDRLNRRKFMESFADSRGFDPLVAGNWYSIKFDDLHARKGGSAVLAHYNSSVSAALLDLFPDIGLHPFNFTSLSKHFWEDSNNKRDFFDRFAKGSGFDSLIATNWYSVSLRDVLEVEKVKPLFNRYQNNLPLALMDVYPDIGLNASRFVA